MVGSRGAAGGVLRVNAGGVRLVAQPAEPDAPALRVDRTVQPTSRGGAVGQERAGGLGVGLGLGAADHAFDVEATSAWKARWATRSEGVCWDT